MDRRVIGAAAAVAVVLALLAAFPVADGAFGLTDRGAAESSTWFRNATDEAGFHYLGTQKATSIRGTVATDDGVYVADVNNDLREDVLAVGGEEPVLYVNTGDGFERSSALPDVPAEVYVRAALFFDADGDGWEDLVLLRHGEPPVLLENERGTFERREDAFDRSLSVPIGASAADYDGDGCTDLFVVQNGNWDDVRPARLTNDMAAMERGNGNPNVLFRGTCGSDTGEEPAFEAVDDAGISGDHWSLAASFVDLTGDGRPDIHVANDFNNDVIYVNEGDGTFERREIPETNRNGMSSEVGDVNGDLRPDIFVTNINWTKKAQASAGVSMYKVEDHMGNNLLINRGNGTFVDRAKPYGVEAGRWGWAAVYADLDNDGDRDLFHTTRGKFYEDPPFFVDLGKLYDFKQARFFERVEEDRFEARVTPDLGFTEELDGRGVARLDYDGDGRLDLAVADTSHPFALFANQRDGGNALQLFVADDGGAAANGARVYVTVDGAERLYMVHARADYLSQDSRLVHVGLGDHERVDEIRVEWTDGSTTVLEDVDANRRLVVTDDGMTAACPFEGERGPIRSLLSGDCGFAFDDGNWSRA